MQITKTRFTKLFPKCKHSKEIVDFLNVNMMNYGIDNKDKLDMFLTQCGYESNGFTVLSESYNYSAERLLEVFPKYFNKDTAKEYAKSPKIFDKVYANRLGNRSESSRDGSTYCGRGFIQLTGRYNYALFAKAIDKEIEWVAQYLKTIEGAVESALWFCESVRMYDVADDIKKSTKLINGGDNGIEDRIKLYNKIKRM